MFCGRQEADLPLGSKNEPAGVLADDLLDLYVAARDLPHHLGAVVAIQNRLEELLARLVEIAIFKNF